MAIIILVGILRPCYPQHHHVPTTKQFRQHLGKHLNPKPMIEHEEFVTMGCGSPIDVQSRNLQPRKNTNYTKAQRQRDQ